MTEVDRARFAEALHVLAETFNEPVSSVRAEAYFDALSDLELWQIERAVRLALKASTWFPKPVELRALVEGTTEERADTAWGEVIQQIRSVGYVGRPRFSDPATFTAIEALWGGWSQLCQTLPNDGPELVGWVKQFKATFQTMHRREARTQQIAGGFTSTGQLAEAFRRRVLAGRTTPEKAPEPQPDPKGQPVEP
jgi:hypothetical protein